MLNADFVVTASCITAGDFQFGAYVVIQVTRVQWQSFVNRNTALFTPCLQTVLSVQRNMHNFLKLK